MLNRRCSVVMLFLMILVPVSATAEAATPFWQRSKVPPIEVAEVAFRRDLDAIPPDPVLTDGAVRRSKFCTSTMTGKLLLDPHGADKLRSMSGRTVRGFVFLSDRTLYWDLQVTAAVLESLPAVTFHYRLLEDVAGGEADPGAVQPTMAYVRGIRSTGHARSFVAASEHHPIRAFDGDSETMWMTDVRAVGVDASVVVWFGGPRVVLDEIVFEPGAFTAADYWHRWSRIRTLDVFVDTRCYTVSFRDEMRPQALRFGEQLTGRWFRFVVRDVYRGDQGEQTALSEIRFLLGGQLIPLNLGAYEQLVPVD